MTHFDIELSGLEDFVDKLKKAANGDFRKEFETFLDALGNEFLRIVQDEYISRNKNTGYGELLTSLSKGGKDNVWEFEDDYCSLEVGTSVSYAVYVNSGHSTSAEGKNRFVPGYWQGNRFVYDPDADSGMMLKFQWVKGLYFWEAAVHAMESIMPSILDEKLQEWLDNYFGD